MGVAANTTRATIIGREAVGLPAADHIPCQSLNSKQVGKPGDNEARLPLVARSGRVWLFRPITRACVRLNLHPDVLSWTSLLFHLMAAVGIGAGYFGLGGSLLLAGAACDALDGAVARARGLSSDSGELLDASVDRWAEMAIFLAYAWYYRWFPLGFFLSAGAMVGAVMVSYVRAKGESMGVVVKSGLMQRHERAVYLCGATLVSAIGVPFWEPNDSHPMHYLVLAALALIAFFANGTALQRFALIRAELRKKGR